MRTVLKDGFFPVRPPEPMQLLASLSDIFPQFGQEDLAEDVAEAGKIGLHCAMRNFTDYFSENHREFSEHQLASLGRLLNEAVTVDDNLENAVSTCMLEHLHQINGYEILSPYLSRKARERTRP
jgi:hypothetical protein